MPQSYTQAHTELERDIYLEAPEEMNLADDEILLAVKPLYGIPESGLHWFLTFQGHHINRLKMAPTKMDPCIRSSRSETQLHGITAIQVEDSFGHRTAQFLAAEERLTSEKFKIKPRTLLKPVHKTTFNETQFSFEKDRSYTPSQSEKLQGLNHVSSAAEFKSRRALIQYIGVTTRPDLCAATQLLSPCQT